MTLAVQSVLDGVYLLVQGSTWMRDVSSDAAVRRWDANQPARPVHWAPSLRGVRSNPARSQAPVRELVTQGIELGQAGLEQLQRAEHQWVPVVAHLLEQIGSTNNNGYVNMRSKSGPWRRVCC